MAARTKAALHQQQPYDNTLKALFEADTADMLSFVVEAPVTQITELTGEALKPPLRVDRGYEVWCKGKLHVVHVELETDGDGEMALRMLEYFGILHRKYKKPIISVVMYPFRTAVPEPPLHVISDGEEVLVFKYRVRKLWEEDVRQFMAEWPASLYVLAPTMQNADYALLSQALDAIAQFYANQRRMLRIRLLWFDLFLTRTDTVPAEDRRRIMQKLDQFDNLLSQSRFVQKKVAEGKEKGRIEGEKEGKKQGKKEGHIEALQNHILRVVSTRFPQLTEVAQQKVARVTHFEVLDNLFNEIIVAPDEQAARFILDTFEE